jgi:type I restriction enzyme S subunit
MSLPRYSEYKDSGVEWLGEVPGHWSIAPLKRSFKIVGGSTPKSEQEAYWDGEIVWVTPSDLSKLSSIGISDSQRKITTEGLASCGTTLVPSGSIVLSTRAPIGSLAIAETELCTNQGCKSLVPLADTQSRFYGYLLCISSDELNIRGKGTTFLELSGDELGAFKVGVPPSTEQQTIATFLDCETGKIDALITEQQRLVELLAEKRQAVISHAVTKGLNPNAPMKDSGIEWLGEVPEHWAALPLKQVIFQIESGVSVNASDYPASGSELGVLKTSCVYSGQFDANENKTVFEAEVVRVSCPLKTGTLIVSRMNTPELVGAAGLVKVAPENIYLPDRLWQVSFSSAEPAFVHYWTQSVFYRAQIRVVCAGTSSSMQNLGQDQFRSFTFPCPPQVEQQTIAVYLDTETAKFDTLTAEANRAIALLQERRSALISAAVTGKIDVRGIHALPQ